MSDLNFLDKLGLTRLWNHIISKFETKTDAEVKLAEAKEYSDSFTKVYTQSEEPVDAPDGSLWLDLDATEESMTPETIGINDFVIAQGTSGGWTYRKWNSGIGECWIHRTIAAGNWNIDQSNVVLYYSANYFGNSAYPFTFIDIPTENATIASPTDIKLMVAVARNNTTTASGRYTPTTTSIFYEEELHCSIYAIGRWK